MVPRPHSQPAAVVRQTKGGTGRAEDDRFRIVFETKLDASTTAYTFSETADLTEEDVAAALKKNGVSTVDIAQALRSARAGFARP